VKLIWSREEDMQRDLYRPGVLHHITVGLDEHEKKELNHVQRNRRNQIVVGGRFHTAKIAFRSRELRASCHLINGRVEAGSRPSLRTSAHSSCR
jgi:hypothetical protein